jgi:hypothetical protein
MVIVLKKLRNFLFFYFFEQIDQVLLTTMGFFFLSKGVTPSFKSIYKRHGQQWGIFLPFF